MRNMSRLIGLALVHSLILLLLAPSAPALGANCPTPAQETCPKPCAPTASVSAGGSIASGDGVFSLLITNFTPGTATANCEATCDMCSTDFLMSYAMYNAGQYCLTVVNASGPHNFPSSVLNYTRPGTLKSNCNPDFAPFFEMQVWDCTAPIIVAWKQVTLDCFCEI